MTTLGGFLPAKSASYSALTSVTLPVASVLYDVHLMGYAYLQQQWPGRPKQQSTCLTSADSYFSATSADDRLHGPTQEARITVIAAFSGMLQPPQLPASLWREW